MWDLIVNTWNTLIFEPVFNLLVVIMSAIPGHNFGLSLVILTILFRFALHPLIKRQLIQMRKQRELQPEIARIKKKHKGNRQRAALETMELFREHKFNPFAVLGYLLLQAPLLICIFQIVRRIAENTQSIIDHSYSFVKDLDWVSGLSSNLETFDSTLLGIVDLTRTPLGEAGWYLPGVILAVLAAVTQYFVARQLSAQAANPKAPPKSFKEIFKASSQGKEVNQAEVNQAVGRSMQFVLPIIILIVGMGFYLALHLFWIVSSVMQIFQYERLDNQAQAAQAEAKIDGQTVDGVITERLNAKQKKEQRQRQTLNSSKRKRVSATVKTVKKTDSQKKKGQQ